MKRAFLIATLISTATLTFSGCAQRTYYGPPPQQFAPALTENAEHNGFRVGSGDGARDAYNGLGYHPKRNPGFRETPGYDPRMGPLGPYQSYFRNAYLHGYDRSFYRR